MKFHAQFSPLSHQNPLENSLNPTIGFQWPQCAIFIHLAPSSPH